ncbi:BofC C-terminal domain-containing protein [Desulfovirgula thermocuniculi]|uniref:BofC C-terminal domain-containing protein n=1 Tax=Desulfovirgula thermocuniculi TaxID=348842 RepID=UPI0004236A3C|nr:BofC C-terminal domain-containing protein [Desulfovirgula thermocuniculi]
MLLRFFYALIGLCMALGVAGAIYAGLCYFFPEPLRKPQLAATGHIRPGALYVQEEREYLCGDVQVSLAGRVDGRAALLKRYPASAGWELEERGGTVMARQRIEDFCPEHRNYRHLGIHDGYLAVFEGPLGHNEKLLRVERSLPVAQLHPDLQLKLYRAMDFGRQDAETRAVLKTELEFSSEQAASAFLDNLDEGAGSGAWRPPREGAQ